MLVRFSLMKKFVFAFLLLSIVPLSVLGVSTLGNLRDNGRKAIESSTAQLERDNRQHMEHRAVELANRIGDFLRACEANAHTFAMLPRNVETYRRFSLEHRAEIWTREGTDARPVEVRKMIPLFREVAFIGADGREEIRIVNDEPVPASELRDVSDPANTTYKNERYFEETRKLKDGDIYVSHVTGWYVTADEQLQGADNIEAAVEGKKYEGVVRFAVPCYGSEGRFEGVAMISLDHRRLMEFTLHVLPTEERFVVFPSYSSGNYAFMFDDDGWIVSHPKFCDIRGVLPDGKEFDPADPAYGKEALLSGKIPFNLDRVAFINPNYPEILHAVREGKSGVAINTFNVGGTPRVMSYAPIFYDRGPYRKYGIFGGITFGVETEKFKEPALLAGARIDDMVSHTKQSILIILGGTALAAVLLAILLARTVTRPIFLLARMSREISAGASPTGIAVRTGDELETLAEDFSHMAREVKNHQESLEHSLSELAESKRSVDQYAQEIEKQLRVFKNIYYLSHYLGNVYDRELVLQTVLKTCVEGLGFDRAILYLYDHPTRRLICHRTFGFTAAHEEQAKAGSYHIDRHDCIPTKVFRTGETIYVKDIHTDERATPLDLKISEVGGTTFYVIAPVKSRDRVIGVLGADTLTSKREIGDTEVESLKILANDAARAMERSDLYRRLVAERNFIESIVTHMTSGIVTLDETGEITWFNPYSEAVFGIKREDALGKRYSEVFAGLPSWTEVIDGYLQDSRPESERPLEQHSIFRDGREKILEVHFSTIRREKKRQTIFLLFLRDITQRKRMEEHISRSDRLISLGVLAAGIAHEMRNPLTGISLLMDDLHDRLDDKPREREMLRKALHEIDRLENLISGLLDFAAPTRRTSLEIRPLQGVIENTLFLVRKMCKNKGIRLTVDSDDSLPLMRLDSERLQQALLNLLLNAIQAMEEGGELRLGVVSAPAEESLLGEPAVRIVVADTGKGIAPDDMAHIFDPFFSRNPTGSGLGLSIVHNIIEEHHGRIAVSSQPDKGTAVWVDLPVAAENGKEGD